MNISNCTGALEVGLLDPIEVLILQNLGNISALRHVGVSRWVASPDLRGTSTILWSCLVTLTACIYTALHLNVPADTSKFRMLAQKGKWVLVGLLAPEVVLYLAATQFLEARRVAKELQQWLRKHKHTTGVDEDYQFTIKYGFFVVMGGLEVSVQDIVDCRLWATRGTLDSGTLRLSADGVIQLAQLGHFIPLRKSKIDDKSKADLLQKCLVMIQVLWMATQCIVRKTYGLPLTLLEVHTMVHVICALVMYLFWMEKPLDVRDPEVVNLDDYADYIALMVQEQFFWYDSHTVLLYPRQASKDPSSEDFIPALTWIHDEDISQRKYLTAEDEDYKIALSYAGEEDFEAGIGKCRINVCTALDCGVSVVARGTSFETQYFFQRRRRRDYYGNVGDERYEDEQYEDVVAAIGPPLPNLDLSLKDMSRWRRIIHVIEKEEGAILEPELFHSELQSPRYPHRRFESCFSRTAGNIQYTSNSPSDPEEIMLFVLRSKILLTLLLVLPSVYGGIHLAVDNFMFPTTIEQILWRVASLDIIITMPTLLAVNYAGSFISKLLTNGDTYDNLAANMWATMYKGPTFFVALAYLGCRIFIVIESFISLRSVPIGVYWTPSWLQMLPHV